MDEFQVHCAKWMMPDWSGYVYEWVHFYNIIAKAKLQGGKTNQKLLLLGVGEEG